MISAIPRLLPGLSVGAVLAYLVAIPIIFVVWSSFKPGGLVFDEGVTFDNYLGLLTDATTGQLFLNTFRFALGATVFSLLIGIVLAWIVERTDAPLRRTLRVIILLPMAIPPVLLGIGWVTALDPTIGAVNFFLKNLFGLEEATIEIYSMAGMIAVEALVLTPTVFLLLAPAFRNMDPNLEDAAFASGATIWTTLRRVILPVLSPAILSAGVFVFILSFVIFDVPGVIGVPAGEHVFSTRIVQYALDPPTGLPDYGKISALAVIVMVLLFILAALYTRLTRRSERFTTITGKGFRAKQFRLGKWRAPVTIAALVFLVLTVMIPFLMLIWMSVMPYLTGVSVEAFGMATFDNFVQIAGDRRLLGGVGNSVIVALIAATGVTLLSLLVSWVVIRHKAPGGKAIDLLAFAPLALAGVMMGTSLIFVYLTFSALPIYGTVWIIAIAHLTAYISFGSRMTNSVMTQISGELEEASSASGANKLQTLRRVTIPLMRPALIGLWIWVTAHSLRELSTALMLQGRGNQVISTVLWDYWVVGRPNTAAAIGVVLVIALAALVIIWQVLSNRSKTLN